MRQKMINSDISASSATLQERLYNFFEKMEEKERAIQAERD
jgi:hypothetical protein